MKFSNQIKYTHSPKISPNNKLISYFYNQNLYIYDLNQFSLINTILTDDYPNSTEWSFDSNYILISNYQKGSVEIRKVDSKKKIATISNQQNGISHCFFSPSSTKVFVIDEICFEAKVYSLYSSDQNENGLLYMSIGNLKYCKEKNQVYSYSKSKKYISFLQNRSVSVFYIVQHGNESDLNEEICLLSCFELQSNDIENVLFTYDDSFIILIESYLYQTFYIYDILGSFKFKYQPYKNKLGVKSYSLSESFFAVGYQDDHIRIFHTKSWILISDIDLNLLIDKNIELNNNLVVFKEEKHVSSSGFVYNLIDNGSIKVQSQPYSSTSIGISQLKFSHNYEYLSGFSLSSPNSLFIWSVDSNFSLFSIVIQLNPISDFQYMKESNGEDSILALCSSNKNVYLISPSEASVCSIPIKENYILIDKLNWSSDGSSLLCLDRCYFFISKMISSDEFIDEEASCEVDDEEN